MAEDLSTLERELGDRLRHTLATVAAERPAPAPARRRRWSRRRSAGLVIVAVGLASAAWWSQNDDAIVRLPVEQALLSGTAPGGDWYLFPAEAVVRVDCATERAVVMVAEAINRPGAELNAGGTVYGEAGPEHCDLDVASWLADPTRHSFGHSRLGPERDGTPWGVYGAFHPTVTQLRVTVDGRPPRLIDTVTRPDDADGPRYVGFAVPADAAVARIELLTADGTVVTERNRTFR